MSVNTAMEQRHKLLPQKLRWREGKCGNSFIACQARQVAFRQAAQLPPQTSAEMFPTLKGRGGPGLCRKCFRVQYHTPKTAKMNVRSHSYVLSDAGSS